MLNGKKNKHPSASERGYGSQPNHGAGDAVVGYVKGTRIYMDRGCGHVCDTNPVIPVRVCAEGGVTSISCVIRELLSDDYSETYYRDDGTPVTTTPTDIVNRRSYTFNPTPLFTAPVSLKSPSEATSHTSGVHSASHKGHTLSFLYLMCYCLFNRRTTATTRAEW